MHIKSDVISTDFGHFLKIDILIVSLCQIPIEFGKSRFFTGVWVAQLFEPPFSILWVLNARVFDVHELFFPGVASLDRRQ